MIKRIIIAVVLFSFLCPFAGTAAAAGDTNYASAKNRLILIQGRVLNAYFDGKYKEIKRAETFYGYGWLDDHRVFVAYQPEGWAEASAKLEVVDAQQSRSFSLGEIGDTGETNFDVNPDSKEIVFNGPGGIELMTVDLNNLSNFKLSHRTRMIKKGATVGWGVFWIDSHTVGYLDTTAAQLIRISIQ